MQVERVKSKLLKEEYYCTRLAHGLTVLVLPKKGFATKLGIFDVRYGTIDLEFCPASDSSLIKTPAGVAHFLEHQLFKKEEGDISHEFARWGSYINAYTSYLHTSYFFSTTAHFRENLALLIRLIFKPYFVRENVERERSIIEQEAKMDLDIPTQRMAQNLFRNLYHHHPLRWEPVGTLASIKEISPEVLQQCYTTFYQPANMVVVLAGDLKPHEVIRELSACLADTNASARPPKALRLDSSGRNPHGQLHQSFPTGQVITRCFPDESPEIRESYQEIKMAVAQPQIMIGYKEQRTGLKGEALIKQDLQTEILLELLLGKASRLYYQLYDAGLINDRFSMGYSNHESYGFTMLGGECPEPEKLHQRLLEAVRHAQRTRFKQKDFQRIKRKYLGHWVRAFDSLHEASGLLVKYYINTLNPFDLPQYLKTISLKEINARLNEHLNEQYHSVSIVRPLN